MSSRAVLLPKAEIAPDVPPGTYEVRAVGRCEHARSQRAAVVTADDVDRVPDLRGRIVGASLRKMPDHLRDPARLHHLDDIGGGAGTATEEHRPPQDDPARRIVHR